MALILPTSSSTFVSSNTPKPHLSLHHTHHCLPLLTSIKAQKNSSSSSTGPTESTDATSSSSPKPQGFGSSSTTSTKKKQKGKKERASIIRRAPIETPKFVSQQQAQGGAESNEPGSNERAFLLTWLGLGSLIIVEGIALAASGFLPEEWDNFFVKYLYPSFTPTVFLFVAGTVVYGVVKYLQNEKPNSSS